MWTGRQLPNMSAPMNTGRRFWNWPLSVALGKETAQHITGKTRTACAESEAPASVVNPCVFCQGAHGRPAPLHRRRRTLLVAYNRFLRREHFLLHKYWMDSICRGCSTSNRNFIRFLLTEAGISFVLPVNR